MSVVVFFFSANASANLEIISYKEIFVPKCVCNGVYKHSSKNLDPNPLREPVKLMYFQGHSKNKTIQIWLQLGADLVYNGICI